MPTYEYVCTDCGERVEVFQRLDDEPLKVCDRCGGVLRKVFHPAGILFKGSGFYATDSRRPSARSEKGGGDGDAKGSKDSVASDPSGAKPSESKKPEPTG